MELLQFQQFLHRFFVVLQLCHGYRRFKRQVSRHVDQQFLQILIVDVVQVHAPVFRPLVKRMLSVVLVHEADEALQADRISSAGGGVNNMQLRGACSSGIYRLHNDLV